MKQVISAFFAHHSFPVFTDVDAVIEALLDDMNSGLNGGILPAGEDMIRTWRLPPEKQPVGQKVIVIDAGGTNFRSCLVTFDQNGIPLISEMEKTLMPGVGKELSKQQFFDQIALNLDHLKNRADAVGFCFSYPMEITSDGDGIPAPFSKEVKAPEVVGCRMGATLAETLRDHGWEKIKKITLINDTVAALLAGAAAGMPGNQYSSYVGFILGTGLNAAYIQPALNGTNALEQQIIVCESGKFNKIVRSDFDRTLDFSTSQPGMSLLEKCCSGAYLGRLCYEVISSAVSDGLFSAPCAEAFSSLGNLSLIEMDAFLHGPFGSGSVLCDLCSHYASPDDYETLYELLDAVVERAARYAAAVLASCVIQSGKGTMACEPVCLLCNGTTFYKTHHLRSYVESFLDESLVRRRGRYYKIVTKENDITIGTAVAGLSV